MTVRIAALVIAAALAAGCRKADAPPASTDPPGARPSILLVTLDTTRADASGPDAARVATPALNALIGKGRRFHQAYATVPETLPSHASIMTGLYPAGHGIHENGRVLDTSHPVIAEQLQQAGYQTAAFVSSFVLARRFGLGRGFEVYDDEPAQDSNERPASATTERAMAFLSQGRTRPLFLWVHYFDAHAPYTPPEPFRGRFAGNPYLGEVAAADEQLGRLIQAFESRVQGPAGIVVTGDHGEGLGEHGESQHGNLLYQSTMHVPLVIAGPGFPAGDNRTPVSIRRIYHTILGWAGLGTSLGLGGSDREIVLGEAMKPFLEYGWRPQSMAVDARTKAILAGVVEAYDLESDPAEKQNLGSGANLTAAMRKALDDYPAPSTAAPRAAAPLDEDARRRLASLGYIGATARPVVRRDAPRPADMARLFDVIDKASGLFVAERYAEVVPLLEQILAADPHNLDAALRLATAHSLLGHEAAAAQAFRKARELAPESADVRMYAALHAARGKDWERAAPVLAQIVADSPERVAAVEALARIRERQQRIPEALGLWQQASRLGALGADELVHLGELAMAAQHTNAAIDAFEQARTAQGARFAHDLELGVLYLAARRFAEAGTALDRVPAAHPGYSMALFKRAQVSVLMKEPDRVSRIEAARRHADATTRELIKRERLFQP